MAAPVRRERQCHRGRDAAAGATARQRRPRDGDGELCGLHRIIVDLIGEMAGMLVTRPRTRAARRPHRPGPALPGTPAARAGRPGPVRMPGPQGPADRRAAARSWRRRCARASDAGPAAPRRPRGRDPREGPVKGAMPAAGRASGDQLELQRLTGLDQALEAGQDHRPAGRDDLRQRPAGIKPPVIDRQPCHLAHRDKIEPHDRCAPRR